MRKSLDRICKKCGSDDWYVKASGHTNCAPCKQASNRAWDILNRDKRLQYAVNYQDKQEDFAKITRNQYLKRKYGITLQEYEEMFARQNELCALCGNENKAKRWHLDHDHATNKVRAILCHHCNLMIGYARDNQKVLASAIEYLEKHK